MAQDQGVVSEERSVFDSVSTETEQDRDKLREGLRRISIIVKILWEDPRTRVGSIILLLYVFMATIGVVIVPKPYKTAGPLLMGPFQSLQYPLGTTGLGISILSLIVHATPFMIKMMISGAVFTAVIAVIVGLLAGYSAGNLDRILSTIMDIALTIPGLPLFIVLATLLQPTSPFVVGIILSVNRWAGLGRQVRSEALSIREESYVEASIVMGMSRPKVLYYDFLPNIMPFVLIRFANAAKGIVYASVALYFLGLLPASGQNWGITMNKAYNLGNALTRPEAFHWIFFPMVAIILLAFGLAVFAQGADRLFNPRIRTRVKKDEQSSSYTQ